MILSNKYVIGLGRDAGTEYKQLNLAKHINIQRSHRQLPTTRLSCLCFAFNSPLAAMALTTKWSGYANHHKGVRVSDEKEWKCQTINSEIEPPKHR
ncbi:hypothetical protein N7524_006361 [Penicillium chrysogenum]|nr:hypothetical protein N7524_006361 [Penicillium chrysogenum]